MSKQLQVARLFLMQAACKMEAGVEQTMAVLWTTRLYLPKYEDDVDELKDIAPPGDLVFYLISVGLEDCHPTNIPLADAARLLRQQLPSLIGETAHVPGRAYEVFGGKTYEQWFKEQPEALR